MAGVSFDDDDDDDVDKDLALSQLGMRAPTAACDWDPADVVALRPTTIPSHAVYKTCVLRVLRVLFLSS